jgi:NAD(P)-dependent dehydrogenase (short-subunit alcohol dehydrogenase family)
MDFNGKVVLVTGASSGIGAAIALKFSSYGAKLAIVGRNEKKLKAVSTKFEENYKEKPFVITADVTKDDDVKRIVSDVVKHFGKIDVLVNNAGKADFQSILSDKAMAVYDDIMATNLRSAVFITHLAAPHLVKTKGNIINISSIASTGVLHPKNFPYCTSKAGLDHFTRAVAFELSQYGVRVNVVNPGPVLTDFMDNMGLPKDEQEKLTTALMSSTTLSRISQPEEIADLVLFLASDMAKSITGVSYVIDNGALLKGSGF